MRSVKRCAYLTMRNPGDFVTDYDVSFDAMAALGWQVETVTWDDPTVDWAEFDAVYICTPWDYPQKAGLFRQVLATIEHSPAHLINDLSLVHWTLEKTYLRDLEARGGAIVPSVWFDSISAGQIAGYFEALGCDKVVVKPQIGGNAIHTFVLSDPVPDDLVSQLLATFADRPFFVQPFMHNILDEGEYSLFFFSNEYSHAILKTPVVGDFRTQEEHGADIKSIAATDALIDAALHILELADPTPVYARVDVVRDDDDRFLLMELELIDPSLYLRTDDGAAGRFAAAFDQRFQILAGI